MVENTEVAAWERASREYVARRAAAGTPEGKAYTARLKALPPAEAAAEIGEMFALCAPEDLADEISIDLQLDPETARLIARELGAPNEDSAEAGASGEALDELLAVFYGNTEAQPGTSH
jgi:hypothetical protein